MSQEEQRKEFLNSYHLCQESGDQKHIENVNIFILNFINYTIITNHVVNV